MCSIPSTSLTGHFSEMATSTAIQSSVLASSGSAAAAAAVGTISGETAFHKLSHQWALWAHLPHDTNWSASSYKRIYDFNTAEEAIAIFETLPPKLVMNCMLFLMRKGIVPMWEDTQNRNGGCFSYKVANKEVNQAWKQLSYVTVGETISTNLNVLPHVNGITISPKKNFCIIKIWMANCNFQNAGIIRELEGITAHGCLFKKHTPEY
jgi:translation initiation factor 4E